MNNKKVLQLGIGAAAGFAIAASAVGTFESMNILVNGGVSNVMQGVASRFNLVIGTPQGVSNKGLSPDEFTTPREQMLASIAANDLPHVQVCKIREATPRGTPAYWRLMTEEGSALDKQLTKVGAIGFEHDLARTVTLLRMAPNECGKSKFAKANHWDVTYWGMVRPVSPFN